MLLNFGCVRPDLGGTKFYPTLLGVARATLLMADKAATSTDDVAEWGKETTKERGRKWAQWVLTAGVRPNDRDPESLERLAAVLAFILADAAADAAEELAEIAKPTAEDVGGHFPGWGDYDQWRECFLKAAWLLLGVTEGQWRDPKETAGPPPTEREKAYWSKATGSADTPPPAGADTPAFLRAAAAAKKEV